KLVDPCRVGVSTRRQTINGRSRRRLNLHVDHGNRSPHIEMIGHTVGERECGDVRVDLEEVLRDDDISREERLYTTGPRRQRLMFEDDLDISVGKVQLVDGVEGKVAVVQSEIELPFSDRVGALSVNGSEAVRGAGECSERRIVTVGEAPCGG